MLHIVLYVLLGAVAAVTGAIGEMVAPTGMAPTGLESAVMAPTTSAIQQQRTAHPGKYCLHMYKHCMY